jgi:hypothetical protein
MDPQPIFLQTAFHVTEFLRSPRTRRRACGKLCGHVGYQETAMNMQSLTWLKPALYGAACGAVAAALVGFHAEAEPGIDA